MKAQVFVGVSGFSYASWKGHFYPRELKNEDFLSYYSQRLRSVEINSSFYAPPSAPMAKAWLAKTETQFRFAFKAPRQITHILKLKGGAIAATEKVSETLSILGERRGPLLFQLPPYLKRDLTLLEDFLAKTSTVPERVFEFRDASWFGDSTYELLEKHGAAFCIAETEDLEAVFKTTCSLGYFRLRKDSYDADTIEKWSEKIRSIVEDLREAFVFLRHDETGENAGLALKLQEKL